MRRHEAVDAADALGDWQRAPALPLRDRGRRRVGSWFDGDAGRGAAPAYSKVIDSTCDRVLVSRLDWMQSAPCSLRRPLVERSQRQISRFLRDHVHGQRRSERGGCRSWPGDARRSKGQGEVLDHAGGMEHGAPAAQRNRDRRCRSFQRDVAHGRDPSVRAMDDRRLHVVVVRVCDLNERRPDSFWLGTHDRVNHARTPQVTAPIGQRQRPPASDTARRARGVDGNAAPPGPAAHANVRWAGTEGLHPLRIP